MWFLQTLEYGQVIESENSGGIKGNLRGFLNRLEKFGFHVTRRAATGLEKYCKEKCTGKSDGDTLSDEEVDRIRVLATEIRSTFDAEALGLFAHILTDGRFSSDSLLNDPWKLFADTTKDRLPSIARFDIEEAAKCIAFQRPTAAAFHLMRATEATLKEFYCGIVKRERGTLMWAAMITKLRGRRAPPDGALLDHLDSIRRNFRNPTQHPEKIYDLSEAQDLFGVCVDVVNRMASKMPETP